MTAKYLLLAGATYYAARWDDFVGAFDDIDGLLNTIAGLNDDPDWLQVISTETWEVAAEAEREWTAMPGGGVSERKCPWRWFGHSDPEIRRDGQISDAWYAQNDDTETA